MFHLFSSLRFRLLLLVLLAVIPALGLILYSGLEQRHEAALDAQGEALRLVRHASLDQERMIQGAVQLLTAIAQLPAIRDRNKSEVPEFLHRLLQQHPFYANIGIIGPDGNVLYSALPFSTPLNYADSPCFKKALETRELVIGEYQIGRISRKAEVPLVYPVFDRAGRLQVMVYTALDLTWLSNLAAKIALPPGATLAIIDRQGTFLVRHPEPEKWVGKTIPEIERVKEVLAKEEGTAEALGIDGNVRLYAFTPLKGMPEGLFMRVGLLKKDVFARANQVLTRNLMALGLVVVMALVAAWLFGSLLIMRGINVLVTSTRRLAEGDLSVCTGLGQGEGEIDQLARAFDQMVAALEHREAERRQAEAELEKVLHERGLILNSAGEGIWGLDRSGKVTFVNKAALEISGYEAQELIGHNIHQLLHFSKADGSPHPQEDCQIYASLVNGETRRVSEDWFWHKDGECFPVEYVSTAIKEGGQVTGAVVVFRDISARRQAEEELQQAKDFLENTFDNSADVIAIVDKKGRFIKWNKAAEKAYGYSFQELKGIRAFDLYADNNELKKMLDQLRREGLVRRYEINMKTKDGHIVPFALSINYLYDRNNEIIGSICVARDRSDIKAAMNELNTLNDQLRAEIQERQQVGQALKEANEKLQGLVEDAQQRTRDITLLNELGDLLQACQDRQEAYAAVAQYAGQLFPDRTGSLFVLNASQNLLEAVAGWGESPSGEQVFSPDDCWAFRRGEVHRVAGSQTGLLCKHIPTPSVADHICIPMMAQGETIGMIHLQSSLCRLENVPQEALGYRTDSKDRLALTLAKQVSLALASLSLRESLRAQAIRDPLTNLFNRRYMEESLKRELQRVKRRGVSLGVIMVDLDHFKKFNDTFGHKAGDAMLVALAALLKNHIRLEDIACRYGGEELLVILPETPLKITIQRAEKLREQISQLKVEFLGQTLGLTTASLGVAAFPQHGLDWEELIRAADAALYRAKEEGRNRVVVAQDLKTHRNAGQPQPGLEAKTKTAKAR